MSDAFHAEIAAMFGLEGPAAAERVRRALEPAFDAARGHRNVDRVGAPSGNLRRLERAHKALASFADQARQAMAEPAGGTGDFEPLKTAMLWYFARRLEPENPERACADGRAAAAAMEALSLIEGLRDGIDRLAAGFEDNQTAGRGGPRRVADPAERAAIPLLAMAFLELKTGKAHPMVDAVEGESIAAFVRFLAKVLPFASVHVHSVEALRKQVERMRANRDFD